MVVDDVILEVAARAMREVVVKRIWDSSYPGVKPPVEWEKLKEDQREAYREEARAAFSVL